MSALLQITMALGSVAMLVTLMAIVRRLAQSWKISAEVQRKLVHIGTGLYALVLPWLFSDQWPVYLLVALSLLVMLVLRLPNSRLGNTLHGVERQSYGDFLLAISIGLCLFLAEGRMFLYVLPIAVLTLGDAAAALAGSKYGTLIFRIEDGHKSFEGSAVFFFVTLIISVFCLMIMTPFAPLNIIVLSLMVAGFGTVVEATSWRGYDNLFLPMGILLFLSEHAADPLSELLLLAVLFVACTVAFMVVAPRVGLTYHAASVYVTAVFLLLIGTAFQNALVPILVLVAHAWCRSTAPCQSKFPDLDIVAGLAIISFGWWVLGNATTANAISFYGITSMGMLMGFCALALTPRRPFIRVVGMLLVAAALFGIRSIVIELNPDNTNWNGPMWPVIAICFALTTFVPSIWHQSFAHTRVAKVTALALLIPLAYYLYSIKLAGYLI